MPASPTSFQAFSPNLGIERIIQSYEGPGSAMLPDSTRVLPTDALTGSAGLRDLYAPAWDRRMQAFLQPQLRSRDLLIPGVLSLRLKQAGRELAEAARKSKSAPLRDAARLLEEDQDLKSLLETYRNLLLQG